jgi:hypothetical protein
MTQAPAGNPMRCGLSASLRAQRSNPRLGSGINGLLRCARNDVDIGSRSRGVFRPRSASSFALIDIRGRREDRVHAAPAVPCAIAHRKRAHEHTGSAETLRPSLRNGFTAYFVLFPENGSFASVATREALPLPDLTPAPRRPNHTTSPYASGAYVYRAISVHRISPRVRDDGQRPSSAARRAELCD